MLKVAFPNRAIFGRCTQQLNLAALLVQNILKIKIDGSNHIILFLHFCVKQRAPFFLRYFRTEQLYKLLVVLCKESILILFLIAQFILGNIERYSPLLQKQRFFQPGSQHMDSKFL